MVQCLRLTFELNAIDLHVDIELQPTVNIQ
jgi:hypothetical protein